MDSIKVIEGWILVKPEEAITKSEGGIILPVPQVKTVRSAEVIQISKDVPRLLKEENGQDAELDYKIGDTVLFYGKTGIPIEDGSGDNKVVYMFLKYDGMLAIEVK